MFTHQPDRVAEICDLLIAKKIRKHYIVNARSEIANRPDVIRKMEQAGFLALLIGVESTQDVTLKSMGKGFTVAQIRQRFEVLRKSKMIINAYFIVGNIGETEEQMLSTASFARSLGVDLIHVSRLRYEPYSGLSELVEQTPGYHIDDDGFVYSDDYSCPAHRGPAQADRPAVSQPAARGGRGDQVAADPALAHDGQSGADDPRLPRRCSSPRRRTGSSASRWISGELVLNICSALAQFERRLIQERTKAGLAAARARGAREATLPSVVATLRNQGKITSPCTLAPVGRG